MDFRPLNDTERVGLMDALRRNHEEGAAIKTSQKNTSYEGVVPDGEVTDAEVINAIRSVPCHYAF